MSKTQLTTLSNDLTVITVKQPIKSAMVGVFVNAGARFETEQENGISHMIEHCVFKGTETRSAKDIALQIEQIGADINAFTGREITGFYVNGLKEHIDPALNILSDVIQNSVFDPVEIEREKNAVVQEIYRDLDDVEAVAMDLLSSTAYPNQPMGRPILGNEEKVRSFSADMLRSYMKSHYNTSNMAVICVGDIKHDKFVKKIQKEFGNIPNSGRIIPSRAEYVGGFAQKFDSTYEQAHIGIAFPAPGGLEASSYVFLAHILGGGMASPLFQELREQRGLCYDVGATVIKNSDHSLFLLYGATSPKDTPLFVSALCKELLNITEGIQNSDWDRSINAMLRGVVLENENRMQSGIRAISDFFSMKKIRSREELVKTIKSMTKENVIAAAKNMVALSQKPTVIIAGHAPQIDYSVIVSQTLNKLL
jgi:predicted Zn-dependent peptidase